jgi:hypothetical protein
MVFGPFDDKLTTRFIVIAQHSGVVCRDPRLLFRVQFPSA